MAFLKVDNVAIRGITACVPPAVEENKDIPFYAPGEAEQDAEGMQTLRVLARNMSFLMKSIALGKEKYGLPEKEEHAWTNFI